LTNAFSWYTLKAMKKIAPHSAHALHGKFQELINLSIKLDKTPRKFGIDEELSCTEVHMLEIIGENEGLSVTDLANLEGVTKGAASQKLKRLENKNLIAKQEDPENSSRSLITLTNKGKIVYYAHKHWHETMDGGFREYIDSLAQDKIDFLEEFLDKIEFFMKQRILSEK